MVRRILQVSFVAAIRSVALTLFPASFISLFAWATAGSSTGNTTDPLRASVWIWLAAHQVPFHLAMGKLSVMPLGAIIFPIWAIRRSFPKVSAVHSKVEGARFFFALLYSLIALALALIVKTGSTYPTWYIVPLYAFVISYLATYNFKSDEARHIRFAFHIFLFLWAIGGLIVSASLAAHWRVLIDLDTVIAPGIIGGLLFFLIQALYLPNAALFAISYFSGAGFHLGAGTIISPTQFSLHEIPAMPILAALPTGEHPALIFLSPLLILALVIAMTPVLRQFRGFKARSFFFIRTSVVFVAIVAALAYLSSGELLTSAMSPVGIPLPRFISLMALALAGIWVATVVVPAIVQRFLRDE